MKTIIYSSLDDFIGVVGRISIYQRTVFRGQRLDWELLPKLARPPSPGVLAREEGLIRDFSREALGLVETPPADDWDWLAVAQQHGLPTRPLDWTKNPLAALWFAVREFHKPQSKPGVVWVFNPEEKDIVTDFRDSPYEGERTKVFTPRYVVRRIAAQDGVFTVHKFMRAKKKFIPLEDIGRLQPLLTKLSVPADKFREIAMELDILGVHGGSLFPGLDGLAARIACRHLFLERTS